MKVKKKIIAVLLTLAALFTQTAGACDDNGPTPSPTTPVVPEPPDGEGDCDLGDIAEFDEDCFDS